MPKKSLSFLLCFVVAIVFLSTHNYAKNKTRISKNQKNFIKSLVTNPKDFFKDSKKTVEALIKSVPENDHQSKKDRVSGFIKSKTQFGKKFLYITTATLGSNKEKMQSQYNKFALMLYLIADAEKNKKSSYKYLNHKKVQHYLLGDDVTSLLSKDQTKFLSTLVKDPKVLFNSVDGLLNYELQDHDDDSLAEVQEDIFKVLRHKAFRETVQKFSKNQDTQVFQLFLYFIRESEDDYGFDHDNDHDDHDPDDILNRTIYHNLNHAKVQEILF